MVELLITAATLGVVLSLLSVLTTRLSRFMRTIEAQSVVQRDGRAAMEQIVRMLRQARASQIVVDSPAGQPPYSRIRFPVAATGKNIAFRQEGRRLIREDNGQSQVLSQDLVLLSFTYPKAFDLTMINVGLSLERSLGREGDRKFNRMTQPVNVMTD